MIRTGSRRALCAILLAMLIDSSSVHSAEDSIERGEYVFRAAGCESCHTDADHDGEFLAGGRVFDTPFGGFYSPNITSDKTHGIGSWTAEEFIRAMREGIGPEGQDYYPVFPYATYTRVSDDDLLAMYAYLQQTPPVAQPNRPHDLPWYMQFRTANWIWKLMFLEPGPFQPDTGRSSIWNRGAYLVTALAHCDECHTPRNSFGALDLTRRMAGAALGGDESAPNISPDTAKGIGNWRQADLVRYLSKGIRPDEEFADGAMAEVIDNGLSHLRVEDLEAMAEYLMSLPAQQNP